MVYSEYCFSVVSPDLTPALEFYVPTGTSPKVTGADNLYRTTEYMYEN